VTTFISACLQSHLPPTGAQAVHIAVTDHTNRSLPYPLYRAVESQFGALDYFNVQTAEMAYSVRSWRMQCTPTMEFRAVRWGVGGCEWALGMRSVCLGL
jgi:hypothetical protein